MKPLSLLLTAFLLSVQLNAQLNPNTKWGKVSQEEIDYNEVSFEKDASAVVLYETGYMNLQNPIETKVYRRIKILNEKGIEEANKKMIFQHLNKLENISGLRAQTINIENGNPVKYEVEKDQFFYHTINEAFTAVDFAFPNVKAGSIIEYEYTMTTENLRWIEAWNFQDKIPTLYSSITINPEGLSAGFATIAVGELFVKKYSKKRDGNNQYQWSLTNIPSYTKYTFSYNPKDQRERLILQLKKYYKWKDNYYNDSPELVEITTKWTDLLKEIDERQKSFNNPVFTRSLLQEIGFSNDEFTYLKNILRYFKSNYSWDRFTRTMPIPEMSNRRVHKEKIGNVADLNLHLYSLLQSAGFNVDLVILSTRDHGKIITSYPYIGQFNSVINAVTLKDGRIFFIDGSDLSNETGYMPLKDYNQYGLVVDPKIEKFLNIDAPLSELYSTQSYAVVNDKLILTKTFKTNGYFTANLTESENTVSNISAISFNEKNKTQPTLIEEKYLGSKTILESDDWNRSFLTLKNPLEKILKTYRFDEQMRERQIEFDFPVYYKVQSNFKIPENYSAEIPANFQSRQETDRGSLIYFQNAEIKDGILQMTTELYIRKSIFSDQFNEIKNFFIKANSDASKEILLKKN